MSGLVPAWAAAVVLAAAVSPKLLPHVSLGDLLLALGALVLWPQLRRTSLPRGVGLAMGGSVALAALSASRALWLDWPPLPWQPLLLVLRKLEVLVALAAGSLAAARGGAALLRGAFLVAVWAAAVHGILSRLLPRWWLAGTGLDAERTMRSFERGVFEAEANHFGALFALALALALPLAAAGRGPWRRAGVLTLLLGGPALLGTGSRTALLAACGGLLAGALLCGRPGLQLLGAASGLALLALPEGMLRRLATLASAWSGDGLPTALSDRGANWAAGLDALPRHLLLGRGPGTRGLAWADSEVLLALDGGGLLGALAYAAILVTLWGALRAREARGETAALAALFVLGLAMCAWHVGRVAIPFALLAGAALGEQRKPR